MILFQYYLFHLSTDSATLLPKLSPFFKNCSLIGPVNGSSPVIADAPNAASQLLPPTKIIPKIIMECNKFTCANSSPDDIPPPVTKTAPILFIKGVFWNGHCWIKAKTSGAGFALYTGLPTTIASAQMWPNGAQKSTKVKQRFSFFSKIGHFTDSIYFTTCIFDLPRIRAKALHYGTN